MSGPWRPTLPTAGFCVGADATTMVTIDPQETATSTIRTVATMVAGLHFTLSSYFRPDGNAPAILEPEA